MNTSTTQVSVIFPTAGSRAEYIIGFNPDDRLSPDETYENIRTEDAAAAAQESDLFDLKSRRAYKLGYLKKIGYHKKKKQSWKAFVNQNFPCGYDVWRRYYPCALVQKVLHEKGLPLAQNEFQTRLLGPQLREADESFLTKLRALVETKNGVLPQACELKARVPKKTSSPVKKTAPATQLALNPFLLLIDKYKFEPNEHKYLINLSIKYTSPGTAQKNPPPNTCSDELFPSSVSPTAQGEVKNAC